MWQERAELLGWYFLAHCLYSDTPQQYGLDGLLRISSPLPWFLWFFAMKRYCACDLSHLWTFSMASFAETPEIHGSCVPLMRHSSVSPST